MTPQQLADDLDKRRLAAGQIFNIANPGAFDVPTIVEQAIAEQNPFMAVASSIGNPAVTPGATAPEAAAPAPGKTEKPAAEQKPAAKPQPIPAPAVESAGPTSFWDMLVSNDEIRLRNKEAFERREKADKARLSIAAVSDALSSLGNLVGTTQGAFSQPQTYQVPMVYEDMEKNRSLARTYAQKLQDNENSINLLRARLDSANDTYALKKELEEMKTDRALAVEDKKTDRSVINNQAKSELESQRQRGRIDLKQMDIDYHSDRDKMLADLKKIGLNISGGRLAEMIRHNHKIEEIRESGAGSGNVGAYTTYVEYDEYGRVVKRWRVPGNGGGSGDNIDWGDDGDEIDWE